MIKIEHTCVFGWEATIRGMRNPKESHSKSDTDYRRSYDVDEDGNQILILRLNPDGFYVPDIGENDLQLMKTLAMAGDDHGKFLRFIHVSCDITAPLYFWKHLDQYKVGTATNACSTMHRIHTRDLTLDDFSHEHLVGKSIANLSNTIDTVNYERKNYVLSKDKDCWWQMIQLLPDSYNQKRTWDANYQVLRNIYHARKNHKLDEWHDFCAWIESLPYAEELICS